MKNIVWRTALFAYFLLLLAKSKSYSMRPPRWMLYEKSHADAARDGGKRQRINEGAR
jgi:hypothetical protein